jgi:hypothetical protein
MKSRSSSIAALVLTSLVAPMFIGAFSGVGLSRSADGNQTFDFALSYYNSVIENFTGYEQTRDEFSETGWDMFGLKRFKYSECQHKLIRTYLREDEHVSSALNNQKSLVLEKIFDQPGVKALEALPSPIVGALAGCRYTIASRVCTAWSRQFIVRANDASISELQSEKHAWLQINEAASCKAAEKFRDKKINS